MYTYIIQKEAALIDLPRARPLSPAQDVDPPMVTSDSDYKFSLYK